MHCSLCRNVMFHRRPLGRVTEDPFFEFVVRDSEAIMLPLMFQPGTHEKRLQIGVRRFCIKENSPPRSSVAATNPLIPIYRIQEVRRLRRIDDVLDGHQNWAEVIGLVLEHARLAPMIPCAEINSRGRKPKRKLQKQGRADSKSRNEESQAGVRAFCRESPQGATNCHAALKNK